MTQGYLTICPHCGKRNDAVSAVMKVGTFKGKEPTPKDGTISFCVDCRRFSIFSFMTPGALRMPTLEEQIDIEASPIGRKILEASRGQR